MKVIVLGGYGGFGARLSRRLAEDGWTVFVAGRSESKASALAAQLPAAHAMRIDRNDNITGALHEVRPFLLIDAAGPFQGGDYKVAQACMAAGVHYFDLADATDFVCNIGTLDHIAKANNVAVISGASSVPALSGAVIHELAQRLDRVTSIDMSISASNRAAAGQSVATAILSSVGKPIKLWRGGRWVEAIGWQKLRREHYEISGQKALRRLIALADVPDNLLFPNMQDRPATIFRAGPELWFQVAALWLLSWPVSRGWLPSPDRFGSWLLPLQKLTAKFGSNRSAMKVSLAGHKSGAGFKRVWTLIASDGCGPEIPVLAAQLLARELRHGRLPPGARNAANVLTLDQYRELFAAMAIQEETTEQSYVPLYARVMGRRFEDLPAPVKDMHDVIGNVGAVGAATVTRGSSIFARIVASIMRFPPAGEHKLHVNFDERDGAELWTRDFSGYRFTSVLSQRGNQLVERFGPMRFRFDLPSDRSGLSMVMRGWSFLGVPMPMMLAPRGTAHESTDGEAFLFDVPIALPLIGTIVHYKGRLRRL